MTAPKADAVSVALDKLERCYADMGLPTAEQETVPAARAELAALRKALKAADEYIGALIENRRTNRQQVRNKVCLTGTAYRAARAQVKP